MRNRQDEDRPAIPADEVSGANVPGDPLDLTPAEREVESALGALRPAVPDASTDRDRLLRLMFRSGQADAESRSAQTTRRQLLAWRAAAAVLLVGLGLSLALRPGGERIVYVNAPADRGRRVVAPATTPAPSGGAPETPPAQRPAPFAPGAAPGASVASAPSSDVPPTGGDYLALRNAVLAGGLDALPVTPGPRSAPPPAPRASDPIRFPTFGDRL